MAALTLVLGIYSALIVRTQTSILERQTTLLREQNLLAEASRRASLNFELTSILDEIDEEMDELGFQRSADFRDGSVTVADFTRPQGPSNPSDLSTQPGEQWIPPNMERDPKGSFPGMLRTKSDIGARLRWRDRDQPLRLKLSDRLQGRVAALSRSFRPYVFLQDDGTTAPRPLSPERGQMLLALIQAGVDMEDLNHSSVTFGSAYLEEVDIRGPQTSIIDLRHLDLRGSHVRRSTIQADLTYSRWDNSDLAGSSLYGKLAGTFFRADLSGTTIGGDLGSANLAGADLTDSDLSSASNWENATVRYAYVGRIRDAPEGFHQWAIENGAIDDRAEWEARVTSLRLGDSYNTDAKPPNQPMQPDGATRRR